MSKIDYSRGDPLWGKKKKTNNVNYPNYPLETGPECIGTLNLTLIPPSPLSISANTLTKRILCIFHQEPRVYVFTHRDYSDIIDLLEINLSQYISVECGQISPDGSTLVLGTALGQILTVDSSSGHILSEFEVSSLSVQMVAVISNGTESLRILSSSQDTTLSLSEFSGNILFKREFAYNLTSYSFNPQSKWIAAVHTSALEYFPPKTEEKGFQMENVGYLYVLTFNQILIAATHTEVQIMKVNEQSGFGPMLRRLSTSCQTLHQLDENYVEIISKTSTLLFIPSLPTSQSRGISGFQNKMSKEEEQLPITIKNGPYTPCCSADICTKTGLMFCAQGSQIDVYLRKNAVYRKRLYILLLCAHTFDSGNPFATLPIDMIREIVRLV